MCAQRREKKYLDWCYGTFSLFYSTATTKSLSFIFCPRRYASAADPIQKPDPFQQAFLTNILSLCSFFFLSTKSLCPFPGSAFSCYYWGTTFRQFSFGRKPTLNFSRWLFLRFHLESLTWEVEKSEQKALSCVQGFFYSFPGEMSNHH